jgi:putative protein kinase ArgK-like GTPase of G3E family
VVTSARSGQGVAELALALDAHRAHLDSSGAGPELRRARAARRIARIAAEVLAERALAGPAAARLADLALQASRGAISETEAARRLLETGEPQP